MKIKYKSDRPFIPSPVLVIMQEYGVGFNSLIKVFKIIF
jgi:hypothetical protein